MWARAGADHADMRIAHYPLPVLVIKQENADEGEIALTPRIFFERPSAGRSAISVGADR